MLIAYLNSPNARITIHHDSTCSRIRTMNKSGQRNIRLDITNMSTELQRFQGKHYPFRAGAGLNDMWLEIDFQDDGFEIAVLNYVQRLLEVHYTRFLGIQPKTRC